jgi:hypothetical protein
VQRALLGLDLGEELDDDVTDLEPTLKQATVLGSVHWGIFWSGWRDLNPRPLRPERSALPS